MGWPITKDDVIKALNQPVGALDDADLTLYARAAVERVEEEVGPYSGQTFTSTARGPASTIVLDVVLASITSITVDGIPTTATTTDLAAGVIEGDFAGTSIIVVGIARSTAPAVIEIAARELAAIWYKQDHAVSGRGSSQFVPLGFAIPREISEKLAPYAAKKLPGIG